MASPSPDPIQRLAIKGFWDGLEAPDYQVGAHFEALDKGVLVAALKLMDIFSHFNFPESVVHRIQPKFKLGQNHLGRLLIFYRPVCALHYSH